MSLVSALTTTVLPILCIAGVGYALGTIGSIDVDPLNTVTLQIFVPALVFHSIVTSTLTGRSTLDIMIGVLLFIGTMILLAEGTARIIGLEEPLLSSFVLVSVFPNAGNFGIPLSEFAFGGIGRTTAVLIVTVQNVIVYTVGVYLVSRAHNHGSTEAMTDVLKLPLLYAALAGLFCQWIGLIPPIDSPLMQILGMVGNASIPLMLIILGIKLSEITTGSFSHVITPGLIKLIVAPAVGIGTVLALGFENVTVARTFILETAAPSAVLPLILTIAYSDEEPDSDNLSAPEFVSTTIFVTTIASLVVSTILIALLQSGLIV